MKISVKSSTGTIRNFEVEPELTVDALKAKIAEADGIAPAVQHLFYGETQLNDGQTIGAAGIANDSVLTLTIDERANPQMVQQPQANPGSRSVSLYIGDLAPEVSEQLLYDIFNPVATVASLRVCRHAVTRKSLGYAYMNFHSQQDAEHIIDTMNYHTIQGRECRIMWSQRDPSMRKSGVSNVFVKGLPADFFSKDLHDLFSVFGNIQSCKVARKADGESKRYGFVQFDNQDAADASIERLNKKIVNECELTVERYNKPQNSSRKYTNLFVKNIPRDIKNKDDLRNMFESYGDITSAVLVTDEHNVSKGFGFVCFKDPEQALKAEEGMNGKDVEGKDKEGNSKMVKLFVGRHMKKAEFERKKQKDREQQRIERLKDWVGRNLYVRNFDESTTEETLKSMFSSVGSVESVKIATDKSGQSRLFGYVLMSQQSEAEQAIQSYNGYMLSGKPLYVALWQPAEVHQHQLAYRRAMQSRGPMMGYQPYNMWRMGGGQMRVPMNGQMRMPNQYGLAPMAPQRGGYKKKRGMPRQHRRQHQGMPMVQPGPMEVPMGMVDPAMLQYAGQVQHMQQQVQQPVQPQPMPVTNIKDILKAIAQETPDKQKRMIGEQLYRHITPVAGEDSPKITGMLLEGLEVSDLIGLLDDQKQLEERVKEAQAVLEEHKQVATQ